MYITVYKASPIPSKYTEAAFQLPSGFPYLVDDDALEVIEPALLYLCNQFIRAGRYKAGPTAEAAAYDLMDWWRYLGEKGRDWTDVDIDFFAGYREDRLATVSPQTHETLKPKTIRRRMSRAFDYCKWAIKSKLMSADGLGSLREIQQLISSPSSDYEPGDPAFEEVPSDSVTDLLPEDKTEGHEHVNVLSPHSWQTLQSELGPLPSEAKKTGDLRPTRDRLASEFSLQTGLRVDEVANLTIKQILGLQIPDGAPDEMKLKMHVTKTKRLRPRDVEVPVYLVRELYTYIDGEREETLTVAKRYWLKGNTRKPVSLFLNGTAARHHAGKPIQSDTLSRQFHAAVLRAGLLNVVDKIDPETVESYLTQVAMHCYHDLRHTFAVWTYYAEKAAGNAEPWVIIQRLLGHKHLSTTLNIYLKHVDSERRDTNALVFGATRRRFSGN